MNDVEEFVLSILRPMLGDKNRYGDLVIKVQAGKVTNIHEGKNHKPPAKNGRR